jgi:hypothetical protein
MTVDELLRRVISMWPFYFQNPASVDAWRATYTETLGHLSAEQLAVAWKETGTTWTENRPPLPAVILTRAPSLRRSAPRKTMREATEYTRDNWRRVIADWWKANESWWQHQIALRPGIDEKEARGTMEH